MRRLILILLTSCAPSAAQLNRDVHNLHSVAVQADERHRALCAPPHPGEPGRKSAACQPLMACLHHLDDASKACSNVVAQLATSGQADAFACRSSRDLALRLCAAQGLVPKQPDQVPHAR